MKTTSRPAPSCTRFGMAALLALAGTVALPAMAADRCPATSPEARSAAFDVDALFADGGTALTPSGQARLSRFARALAASAVEVVVVSVSQPQGVAGEAWRTLRRQRAEQPEAGEHQRKACRDRSTRRGMASWSARVRRCW